MLQRFLVLIIQILLFVCSAFSANLFSAGKSDYVIYVSPMSSISEKTAANELQYYLKKIGNVSLNLITDLSRCQGRHVIYIGYNSAVASPLKISKPQDNDESYTYRTQGDDLFIYGGKQRGTMYGVFSFIEQQLGVRWYTQDCTIIPRFSTHVLGSLNHSESPAIGYRQVLYYVSKNADWDAHNKINVNLTGTVQNQYGNLTDMWGAHTLSELLPVSDYYDKHPEFFSMRDGKRIKDGQLCLSNKQVLAIVISHLREFMRNHRDFWAYSVTQNDNQLPCECSKCRAIENKYGGHSGLMIWFVNQVADAVKDEFPDKYVATFAYQYTRKAPTGIVPRKNVVIRLCDVECCFAHPLEECSENMSFLEDIAKWSKLTNHLYVWDYVTSFAQYLAPYPNMGVLAENIRTFKKYNAIGILEEGQYQTYGGDFAEMKAWILSKLLWNPNQDVQQLSHQFIYDYYGKVADDIWKYYGLYKALVTPSTHIHLMLNYNDALYTDAFLFEGRKLLDKALKSAKNDEILRRRVEAVRAQLLYLQFKRSRVRSVSDGSYLDLINMIKRDRINVTERQTAEKFLVQEGFL